MHTQFLPRPALSTPVAVGGNGVGIAVGGDKVGVFVGGNGVGVSVAGTGVGVSVAGTGVAVKVGVGVSVGGKGVSVGVGVGMGVSVGMAVRAAAIAALTVASISGVGVLAHPAILILIIIPTTINTKLFFIDGLSVFQMVIVLSSLYGGNRDSLTCGRSVFVQSISKDRNLGNGKV